MTRILATTIVRGCSVHETSGYLYVADIDEGVVLRRCPIAEAPFRTLDPNPRGGMRGGRGIAVDGDEVYIANFSSIYRFDASWGLIDVISHPACADIHEIAFHDGSLWVTSTRNDLLFQFHPDGSLLDCLNIRTMEAVSDLLKSTNQSALVDPASVSIDFRDPGSHDPSQFDRTHLNGLLFRPDGGLLLSLGQMDTGGERISALLTMDHSGDSQITRVSGNASVPRHNLVSLPDGTLLCNDTPSSAIVHVDGASGDVMERIDVDEGYLRGLLRLGDGRLVLGAQNDLIITTFGQDTPQTAIRLSSDARESVHSIAVLSVSMETRPQSIGDS